MEAVHQASEKAFKITVVLYAVSQIERIFYHVGENNSAAAMNAFLAIVVVAAGLFLLTIRNKSLNDLQRKVDRLAACMRSIELVEQ